MLKVLTRAESAGAWVALLIAASYSAAPLALYGIVGVENDYFLKLATVSGLGAACIYVGSRIRVFDRAPGAGAARLSLPLEPFLGLIWIAFLLFIAVVCITAERIPFVAALQGADLETTAVLRERFLKARTGWESSFPYINAVLAGALVPYSLMLMQLRRSRHRWTAFGLFLLYCISFVEKVFFFKAAIPLFYVVAQQLVETRLRARSVVAGAVALLAAVTIASGVGSNAADAEGGDFFSATSSPASPAAYMLWRAAAVPIITAADTFRVFEEEYGSRLLLGASSSLLAAVTGQERVNVERDVFAVQWGQSETETGSANSVYLTEAYVNFGYAGVVFFSLLIGLILRLFATSDDEAFRSLWMLFGFAVFVSGLVGILLSNGFLLVILLSATVQFRGGSAALRHRERRR
jgi:hypothetical protein